MVLPDVRRPAPEPLLQDPGARGSQDAADILLMLEHVDVAHGSTTGYLRWLGLTDDAIEALRRRMEP